MSKIEYTNMTYGGRSMIEIMKALSDENRLRVLHLITIQPWCVCEIEVLLDMTQSNVSRHLSKLRQAKIIKASKDAQWVHYTIDESFLEEHDKLYLYLKESFENQMVFKEDSKRVIRYKEKNLNCTLITKDKEKVLIDINS